MSDTNKAIMRRFIDAFATSDRAVLEEVLAPNFVIHVLERPPSDRESYLQYLRAFSAAFKGIEVTIEDQIAEADRVATRLTWQATHDGEFQGIAPTGKQISVSGFDVARIVDGKIVERWTMLDLLGMMRQLGALPSPEGS